LNEEAGGVDDVVHMEKMALNAMEKFEIKKKRLVNHVKPRPTPLTAHAPQSL